MSNHRPRAGALSPQFWPAGNAACPAEGTIMTTRDNTRPYTHRPARRLLAAGGSLLLLALAACGGSSGGSSGGGGSSPANTATGTAARGGVYRTAVTSFGLTNNM